MSMTTTTTAYSREKKQQHTQFSAQLAKVFLDFYFSSIVSMFALCARYNRFALFDRLVHNRIHRIQPTSLCLCRSDGSRGRNEEKKIENTHTQSLMLLLKWARFNNKYAICIYVRTYQRYGEWFWWESMNEIACVFVCMFLSDSGVYASLSAPSYSYVWLGAFSFTLAIYFTLYVDAPLSNTM